MSTNNNNTLLLLLLFMIILLPITSSTFLFPTTTRQQRSEVVVAFAVGFGATDKKKQSKNKNKEKKNKRKNKGGFLEIETMNPDVEKKKSDTTTPELDKWGLPPPTEDDIFPPLPSDTIIKPSSSEVNMKILQDALKDHIQLDLEKNFDDNLIERRQESNTPKMKLKLLHESPPVLEIQNFFTTKECQEVISVAEGGGGNNNKGSPVEIQSATFSTLASSKRTSTSWFCHYAQMPTLLAKASHVLGLQLHQTEEPQIVRYRTGEEFTWHYDEVPRTQLHNGGQRLATLLVYLNDSHTKKGGGGTMFRDLIGVDKSLVMKPKEGSALLFFPAFKDGQPDDRTLHKGEIAIKTKWICQIWIHQHLYQPSLPPGNSHDSAIPAIQTAKEELGYI